MKKITLLLILLCSAIGFGQVQTFEAFAPGAVNGQPAFGWRSVNKLFDPANGPLDSSNLMRNWEIANTPAPVPAILGARSAYLRTEEIGQGNKLENWLFSQQLTVPANGQLSFYTRTLTLGNQNSIFKVYVTTSADPTSASATFVELAEWNEIELTQNYNVFEQKVVDIKNAAGNFFPAGTQLFIAFVREFTQPTNSQTGDAWFIDNVDIVEKCIAPTTLASSSQNCDGAVLTWAHTGVALTYQLEVIESQYQPTGVPTHTGITVKTATIDGLLESTTYKFYVRTECTTDNFSDWAGPFNFITKICGVTCADPVVINSLPYIDTNNTANFADNYDANQGNSCNTTPATTNYVTGNDAFYNYVADFTGFIDITLIPTNSNDVKSSIFVFNACNISNNSCLAGAADATSEPRNISAFPVTAGESYTFLVSSATSPQTVNYTLIIQKYNCSKPTDLAIKNSTDNTTVPPTVTPMITTDGVTIQWSDATNTPTSQYNIFYKIQGATSQIPDVTGQITTNADGVMEYLIPGLTPATKYEVWIRKVCPDGAADADPDNDFSAWTGPLYFNTLICDDADKCTYIIRTRDANNNGWSGNRMQIYQNGILLPVKFNGADVANGLIGNNVSGSAPQDFSVQICPSVPFELVWTTAGTNPQQCIVEIINSFGQIVYTKAAGVSEPLQMVYSGMGNCATPECNIAPTNVTVVPGSITTIGATFDWDAPSTDGYGWEMIILPAGSPEPTATTPATYGNITAKPFVVPNTTLNPTFALLADTSYDVYVRVICATSPTGSSDWSALVNFKTLPTCPKPTALGVVQANITTTSATLTWTNGTPTDTTWDILLIPGTSMTPPTGDPVIADGIFYNDVQPTTSEFNATGLTAATIYYYYIRTVCPPDDQSTWSGPFVFNTLRCLDTDMCTYKFFPATISGTGNWGTGRMEVRQNGIPVAEFGTPNNTINNANGVSVQLCPSVPYELVWTVLGNNSANMTISVQNPFVDLLYTKPAGEIGLGLLFEDIVNCTPSPCAKPTDMTVTNIGSTSAHVQWTDNSVPASLGFDLYVVLAGEDAPLNDGTTIPTHPGVTNGYVITDLLPSTVYTYYVRAICENETTSSWTVLTPITFTTTPVNDLCINATPVTVNSGQTCDDNNQAIGNIFGSTNTGINTATAPTGAGCQATHQDVWYSFVATATSQTILISDVVSTPASANVAINHSVFSGTCDSMTLLYCSTATTSAASELIVGNTYYIRVYKATNNAAQSATFKLCIISPPANDECATSTTITPNASNMCEPANVVSSGTFAASNSTIALDPLSDPITSNVCAAGNVDVWFDFIATSTNHTIIVSNVVSTPSNVNVKLNYALFKGTCGNLELVFCSNTYTTPTSNLVIGEKYYIRVYKSTNVATQSATFDICIISPPTNDECINAITAPVNPEQFCLATNNVSGSTIGSTASLPVLDPALTGTGCGQTNRDVWYKFVATATSHMITFNNIVTTPETATNVRLNHSVFSGTCDNLTKLFCFTTDISMVTGLTPGDTYFVRVYTASNNNDQSVSFDMCILSPPSNDECANSKPVIPNSGQVCAPVNMVKGSTLVASPSLPVLDPVLTGAACGQNRNDIWYHFVATQTSHAISLNNLEIFPESAESSLKLNFSVFSGTCDNLTNLLCSTDYYRNVTGLTVGETYYIRVYTSNTNVQQYITFDLCITSPPINDECAAAINVPVNSTYTCAQRVYGSTIGATESLPTTTGTNCSGTNDDVWYKFTASAGGVQFINVDTIEMSGANVIVNHALFSGTCDALVNIYCSNASSSIATGLTEGEVYYIRVYTAGVTPGHFAKFTVCVKNPPLPAENEDCVTSMPVPTNTGGNCEVYGSGNLIGAGPSGVTNGCTGSADDDVWFSFVATTNQHFINLLNIEGSTTNLNHAVYTGTCTSLTQMYCAAANTLNSTSAAFVVGQTYYVRVWSNQNTPQIVAFDICIKSKSTCETAEPFCYNPSEDFIFPNTTGVTSTGQIACLFSVPNPTFYYMQVQSDGDLVFNIRQSTDPNNFPESGAPGRDVDFVAWGPFDSPESCDEIVFGPCPTGVPCNNNTTSPGNYPVPGTNIVDCSYSADVTEDFHITNAQAGQFYLLLLTNYNGQPGYIQITQTNFGTPSAGTSVNLCCDVQLGGDVVTCQPSYEIKDIVSTEQGQGGTYIWYFNNAIIENQTTDTIIATETGVYRAVKTCGLNDAVAEINVEFLPEISSIAPEAYHVCEGTTAGFGDFDLNTITHEVLGINPAAYMITFHESEADALGSTSPIVLTTPYNSESTTLYIRIQSNSVLDCFKIQPLELVVDTLQFTSFEYGSAQYCTTDETNPVPTFINDGIAGEFTATPNGLVIDPTTGEIILATSSEGVYTITNSLAADNACNPTPTTFVVTITKQRVAEFTYGSTEFCNSGTTSPIFNNGGEAGSFTVVPESGLSLNPTTGEINLETSSFGTYEVTNSFVGTGGCTDATHSFTITVTEFLSATIAYNSPFCLSTTEIQNVTITGATGGTFSAPTGLSIDTVTGDINPNASLVGSYLVKYHVPAQGSCDAVNAEFTVVITDGPTYEFVHGCEGGAYKLTVLPTGNSFNPANATLTWSGGAFTAVPGEPNSIILQSSGSYSVTITSEDGCTTVSDVLNITSIGCQIQRGISPDGNGDNDTFDLSLYNVKDIKIFNRYGTEVYSYGAGYTNQWMGQSSGGKELPNGTYFYIFTTQEGQTISDWIYINRTK